MNLSHFSRYILAHDSKLVGASMTDETENDVVCLTDPLGYDDTIAQRTAAFAQLAALTSAMRDEELRDLSLSMLRKINASVKMPPSATVTVIKAK